MPQYAFGLRPQALGPHITYRHAYAQGSMLQIMSLSYAGWGIHLHLLQHT